MIDLTLCFGVASEVAGPLNGGYGVLIVLGRSINPDRMRRYRTLRCIYVIEGIVRRLLNGQGSLRMERRRRACRELARLPNHPPPSSTKEAHMYRLLLNIFYPFLRSLICYVPKQCFSHLHPPVPLSTKRRRHKVASDAECLPLHSKT